jgi:6-pyruvoyltetrahydropterin/6-carboxytetrahydropterin synthase
MKHLQIDIARAEHKFSCAHMTVFPDGSKERLHGHNSQVSLTLELADLSFAAMVPFAPIKSELTAICARWKERVLLAERNPFLVWVRRDEHEVEFRLCGARYVLPAEDILLLPIDNVSVEALAGHLADLLAPRLRELVKPDTAVTVTVSESPGQSASCTARLG